jgi:hypothetical protein
MKLPEDFSPVRAAVAAGIPGNASFTKPPGGSWSGTVIDSLHRFWLVEELKDSWQLQLAGRQNVDDVYAGPDLKALLERIP